MAPIHHPRPRRAAGFTLVEMTIVVLILAILAAVVIPKITAGADESRTAACATTVKSVEAKVQERLAQTGTLPAALDADWFADKTLPINPWDMDYTAAATTIWVDSTATETQTHPALKHIRNLGTFWYNPKNGRFRALVPTQSNDTETLQLYNECNAAAAGTIGATVGG